MKIGVPKEIKDNENRVAATPAGVHALVEAGHDVVVQTGAGAGSGITDGEYTGAGATLEPDADRIWAEAEMIIKVKEPVGPEYGRVREGQIVFTYFHFAAERELTDAMIKSGGVCIAYETVETARGSLPLLTPMSEVAGRMAIQEGAKYLERPMQGRGILLGGVPGVEPGKVVVIGGGVVGTNAAKMAAGIGAHVYILDTDIDRLRYLDDVMAKNVETRFSNAYVIAELAAECDLLIGAVLVPGAKAPKLVPKSVIKTMKQGAVVVDVAVDQGGCIETTRPTTHSDPVFVVDGVVHYCVTNMPGAVGRTSTFALTNATMPYLLELADKGWRAACAENPDIAKGANIVEGKVVYPGVAEAFEMECAELSAML